MCEVAELKMTGDQTMTELQSHVYHCQLQPICEPIWEIVQYVHNLMFPLPVY